MTVNFLIKAKKKNEERNHLKKPIDSRLLARLLVSRGRNSVQPLSTKASVPVGRASCSGCSRQGERDRKCSTRERRHQRRVDRRNQTDLYTASCCSPHLFSQGPWLDCPSTGHLFVNKARMGKGREVWRTGGSLGQASQGVDLTGTGILVSSEIDGVGRVDGGIFIKEVVGPEEEAHPVPHSHGVGNVFCMWDVQKTSCYPGYQVLAGERKKKKKKMVRLTRHSLPPQWPVHEFIILESLNSVSFGCPRSQNIKSSFHFGNNGCLLETGLHFHL